MGLDGMVRSAVATAKSVAASLQVEVQHEAWIDDDSRGDAQFAAAVARPALVTMKQTRVTLPNGEVLESRAVVTFLEPVPANGAANRREPIDPRDRITLPDGTTGPILQVSGPIDPATNAPYMVKVMLGA